MPELPEVETIARGLAREAGGRVIESVTVRRERSVQGDRAALDSLVPGRRVDAVRRRGKLLLMNLPALRDGTDIILAFHLRMTGRLTVPADPAGQPGKHTHLVFRFTDGGEMWFEDARTFGGCRVATPESLEQWEFYRTLGPEPLDTDPGELAARLAGRAARIKGLLLDQRVVAGIGNIYADESLFRAGIRPDARAADVGEHRLVHLFEQVREVLAEAIADCGSSISDYRDARGDAGAFQNKFRVYGRAGQPCVACGRVLKKTTVAGRTTVMCPRCQEP